MKINHGDHGEKLDRNQKLRDLRASVVDLEGPAGDEDSD
jgi:hypothetical protein